MFIQVLKSKIHCVKVTEANLDYVGSITIDQDLMDAANIMPGEHVYIADNFYGDRCGSYVIRGGRGSGVFCFIGAAARKVQVGDIVIIMAYGTMTPEEAKTFTPSVIFPDKDNRIGK